MKTASFVLEEDQIKWIADEQKRQGKCTASAIMRRLIGAEMALQQRCVDRLSGEAGATTTPYLEQG